MTFSFKWYFLTTPSLSLSLIRPKTGFQLWLEDEHESLQDENPELSEGDLTVLAARTFKELPKADQQVGTNSC